MPATTRSKRQAKLEDKDVSIGKASIKRKAPEPKSTTPAKKIKTEDSKNATTANKKTSKAEDTKNPTPKEDEDQKDAKAEHMSNAATQHEKTPSSKTVTINRAPVLELWGACVASFLHPKLSWETCLSIGSSISALAAISKGRAIGTINQPDTDTQSANKDQRKDDADAAEEVKVMSFTVRLKDGSALVSGKPKKANEALLNGKFGGAYDEVKKTMVGSLEGWKGKEDELNGKAFRMYESFRPSVGAGQKGWGRKGVLDLGNVEIAVSRG